MAPKISVAMATYNGEKYLREQLDSIYAQNYGNLEVVVSDDGSTDATIQILQEYAEKCGLRYFSNTETKGFVGNFESALKQTTGDYIALADQDDIWLPNRLHRMLELIGDNLLLHTDCKLVDENDNVIKEYWKGDITTHRTVNEFLFSNVVTGCTALFTRELLEMALPFPVGLAYHDWWLAVCAASKELITYSPECLTAYRQHDAQDTGAGVNLQHSRFSSDIVKRMLGGKTAKYFVCVTQYQNIQAILQVKEMLNIGDRIYLDSLKYFRSYIKNVFHPIHLWLAIKYNRFIRPNDPLHVLKALYRDLMG